MFRPLRLALRQLRQAPGFAITAILTLALGTGASTAAFAVLDAVLLEPLPFAQPDRLVAVASQPDRVVSIPTMQDYQSRSVTFISLAAYRQWSPVQKPTDAALAHRVVIVSQGFFATLGARFALGTGWPITGQEQDCTTQAVVSGGYWKRLGGGTTLTSKALHLDGRTFQIAGVLPVEQAIEGSYSLNQPEIFVQIGCDSQEHPEKRGSSGFELIGRLRPRVTIAQAAADLARVDQTLRKDYPTYYGASRAAFTRPPLVFPYVELLIGTGTRPALLMTFAACGLLLLIACANLANLLLARNTRRRAEFATRATLGASLGQLFRQLLVESSLLTGFGATTGIALASGVLQLVKRSTAFHLPRLAHASVRPSVLAFTILVSAVLTFLLTLLPALRTLRPGLLRDMQALRGGSAGRSLRFAGRLLVVAQLTWAVVLVACAGWMVGGVYLLLHQPLGFTPDHLLMAQVLVDAHGPAQEDGSAAEPKLDAMADSLRQLPGVASVVLTDHPPLGHAVNRYTFCSDLHPDECRKQVNINPNSYAISPGYFSALGQPLLGGREFTPADDGRNHVAIVNRALATREWPGQSAIGHRIDTGEIHPPAGQSDDQVWATVVGVVADVHNYDLVSQPGPDLYIPRAEHPSAFAHIVLRTNGDPSAVESAVRARLRSEFPSTLVFRVETMAEEMSSEVSERTFLMQAALAFGGVALFLSILGTYGLLAYEVSLREKEIGIRLALGSSRQRVVGLLLHQEGRWLAGGALLGSGCAAATGYLLQASFYGIRSTSLTVLLASSLLLLVSTLLAIALPAGRAALQDPAQTLRRE